MGAEKKGHWVGNIYHLLGLPKLFISRFWNGYVFNVDMHLAVAFFFLSYVTAWSFNSGSISLPKVAMGL